MEQQKNKKIPLYSFYPIILWENKNNTKLKFFLSHYIMEQQNNNKKIKFVLSHYIMEQQQNKNNKKINLNKINITW